MLKLRHILLATSVLVVGGGVALAGAGWFFLHRGMPEYAGQAAIPGLTAPVSIYRDGYGVPHIFAATDGDAARALGYTHASERMFQMEMQRRAGQGRLSEIIGPDMLGVDKFVRTMGFYHLAESSYAALSPAAQRYFQAYADGVNAWLNTHQKNLPPEFALLHTTPEPWHPADSVVWGKLMALQLSHNYKLEMLRAHLAKTLTGEQMKMIFPPLAIDAPLTTQPHALPLPKPASPTKPASDQISKTPATETQPATAQPSADMMPESLTMPTVEPGNLSPATTAPATTVPSTSSSPVPMPSAPALPQHKSELENHLGKKIADQLGAITGLDHAASNEWVIAGSRTDTGRPILANDPHLSLEAPILWYLARIVTPEDTIKGATVPGLPIVLLGQNDHIAWGFTTTGSDVEDLFIETLDAKDPDLYLTPEGPRPFGHRQEIIHVKGAPDVTLDVRSTRHGPVLSDIDPDMQALAGDGKVMALAFTGLDPHDTTSEALWHLDHAANWNDFRKALDLYQAPPQNIVYADTAGNIGFFNAGLVPVREHGDGLMPVDGASGHFDWRGYVPSTQLPQLYNPGAGVIFNANNALQWTTIYNFGSDWEESWRAERLQQFFNTITQHTLDTSAAMQADDVSLVAHDLMPYLLRVAPSDARAKAALDMLKNWDGTMDKDRPEPLIFDAWLYQMHKHLLVDKAGDDMQEKGPYNASAIGAILSRPSLDWCGDAGCDVYSAKMLDAALDMITERQGGNMQNWRWGREQIAVLRHKLFSHVPVLKNLTDLSVASNGDFYTLDRGGSFDSDPEHPFARTHGAGYRGIYDLADPDKSRFMITTGESGHIMSPHYGDLVPLWNNVKAITLSGTQAELESQGLPKLTLTPSP